MCASTSSCATLVGTPGCAAVSCADSHAPSEPSGRSLRHRCHSASGKSSATLAPGSSCALMCFRSVSAATVLPKPGSPRITVLPRDRSQRDAMLDHGRSSPAICTRGRPDEWSTLKTRRSSGSPWRTIFASWPPSSTRSFVTAMRNPARHRSSRSAVRRSGRGSASSASRRRSSSAPRSVARATETVAASAIPANTNWVFHPRSATASHVSAGPPTTTRAGAMRATPRLSIAGLTAASSRACRRVDGWRGPGPGASGPPPTGSRRGAAHPRPSGATA